MTRYIVLYLAPLIEISLSTHITCPLTLDDDELPLLESSVDGVQVSLVADTGSFTHVVFRDHLPGGLRTESMKFQSLAPVEGGRKNARLVMKCDQAISINGPVLMAKRNSHSVHGILGLSPVLLEVIPVQWDVVEIAISDHKAGELRIAESRSPVQPNWIRMNSKHYWATEITSLVVGDVAVNIPPGTSVIFDTGSNYFGFSSELYDQVKSVLGNRCDETEIRVLAGQHMLPFRHAHLLPSETNTCEPAIFRADQSRFAGHLSQNEVVIIGTRGLRGKTLSLHKSSKHDNIVYYLSIS